MLYPTIIIIMIPMLYATIIIIMIPLGIAIAVGVIIRWQHARIIPRICPGEILFLDTAEERFRVYRRGLKALLTDWRTWIAVITVSVVLILLSSLVDALTLHGGRRGDWSIGALELDLALVIHIAIVPLIFCALMYIMYRRWMQGFLRQYLSDHGIPICQKCGYDLRGQTEPRCPECGAAFGEETLGAHPVEVGDAMIEDQ